jgi:hypothetical protein
VGSGSSPFSCRVFLPLPLLQAFLLLIAGPVLLLLPAGQHVCLQLTWEVGLPPSVEFSSLHHSHKLSCSWLLGARPRFHPLQPGPACLFTVPVRSPLPPLQRSGHSTLFAMCLCSYCLLLSFSFFPGWGLVCPGGYADLAQGCLWEYCIPLSSPCGPRLPKPSGRGRLAAAQGPS